MKKQMKLVLFSIFCLILTACSGATKLDGKYVGEYDNYIIIEGEDISAKVDGLTSEGSLDKKASTITLDNQLAAVLAEDDNYQGDVYQYEVDSKTLTLTDEDGKETVFTREEEQTEE